MTKKSVLVTGVFLCVNLWIIEMAELSAAKKAEVEAVKHFISKQEDNYRQAYGRRVGSYKRQCVFFGTTNDFEFLKDRTGNRRFWPVATSVYGTHKVQWVYLGHTHQCDMATYRMSKITITKK